MLIQVLRHVKDSFLWETLYLEHVSMENLNKGSWWEQFYTYLKEEWGYNGMPKVSFTIWGIVPDVDDAFMGEISE